MAIVCALVSADMYNVGTFVFNASASASVDLPAPGAPANMETSERLIIILFDSKALKQLGRGSPPIEARPTDLTSVRTISPYLILVFTYAQTIGACCSLGIFSPDHRGPDAGSDQHLYGLPA